MKSVDKIFILVILVIIICVALILFFTNSSGSSSSSGGSSGLTGFTGTAAFNDSLQTKIDSMFGHSDTAESLGERKSVNNTNMAALDEQNKKNMIRNIAIQIGITFVDVFKIRLLRGGFKLLKVFSKLVIKIGISIAELGARQLSKIGLRIALKDLMKKLSSKIGLNALRLAVKNLGIKAGKIVASNAAKGIAKVSNPVSAFFTGISMVLDVADALGANVTELNYSQMLTNEMFYDLKVESNMQFEEYLIDKGLKNNIVLSPLDKLTSTELADYISPILIDIILNIPNPSSGKTNLETWINEKLEIMLNNNVITQNMIDSNSYKTNDNIIKLIENKIDDELEIFIDLPENNQFISISVSNIMNQFCKVNGGILVNPDKTTFAGYTGYSGYANFSKEIGVCSYVEKQCVDGIAFNKSKLKYDENTNPDPDLYGEWDGTKCKMVDPVAMLNCKELSLNYDPKKTLCKDGQCVSGLCSVDGPYCSKFGMQYITNPNIYNEKNETQKDCLTDATQDITEFLFGTVFTRSFKNLLGIGTKQEGETCVGSAQCNGNVPGKIGTLSCCADQKTGNKTCTPQISDWAGIGYCPSECRGSLGGNPGTCPRYEKCGIFEDDKGDGTTCTVNCERKYPNKSGFSTLSDKCVTCNNEGKNPKTQTYIYERTASSESSPDACKIGGIFGDCKYYDRKDAKNNDVKAFQHVLTGKCYSCQNDSNGKPYNRTLSNIDASDACKATSCEAVFPGSRSTEYLTSGLCYNCSPNMSRTPIGLVNIIAEDGCRYDGGCPAKYPDSFEYSGKCYKCPNNKYKPTLAGIYDSDKCKLGGIIGDCSLLPGLSEDQKKSGFQDGLSGKCYSCYPGFRNLNPSGSGRECSMPCENGWSRDELAGVCYQCPEGFNRNLESVWSPNACTEGWNLWSTRPANIKSFVEPWQSLGSLISPAYPVGEILSKPNYVGTINSVATLEGSTIKPLTILQNGPLTRKKKVITENFVQENFVQKNSKYIGIF
uniref:Uncharacterized protein n=1 Tax=viral metagenome TaxID=1070528 RepID=A0A6C0IGB7_9ZZZZ